MPSPTLCRVLYLDRKGAIYRAGQMTPGADRETLLSLL